MKRPAHTAFQSPLLALMQGVAQWASSARSDDFWRTRAEHGIEAESLRASAKAIIVWLELKGETAAAARLDGAMTDFREARWELEDRSEAFYAAEDARCGELREAMCERAGVVAGVCEDLDGEIPSTVWERFGDE